MKSSFLIAAGLLALVSMNMNAGKHVIKFDPSKEMSGAKIALHDINPDLPTDWTKYNYVVVEYRVSTAQRFFLGFTTGHGYDEVRIHSYVPGQWNRLAIPLIYYNQPPASAIDMAATYNKPRFTGWVNLGGNVGSMTQVDSIGVRMRAPIGKQQIEIRNVTLSVEDPGDTYLGKRPAVDEFGQSNLVNWKGKVTSLKQLRKRWQEEEDEPVSIEQLYGYSKYGGYLSHRYDQGTGFFRTALVDGRWWFVDPEGYLFLSVGVDCVYTLGGGDVRDVEKRKGMIKCLPPERFLGKGRNGTTTARYALWNRERRFGEDAEVKAAELTFKRMDKWGVNTIGNWSDKNLEQQRRKAITCTFYPAGADSRLMGLGDVYGEDFEKRLRESLLPTITPNKDNPWLIGYFMGNEPSWIGQEQRLCQMILAGEDRGIKTALKDWIGRNGDTREQRRAFVYDCFRRYIEAVKKAQAELDPNHLCLGYRFASVYDVNETLLGICGKVFDVLSFNCYSLSPEHRLLDRVLRQSGLPMMIGEFHFGSVDRGQGQSLWQVNSQAERGVAYRYYVENGYAHPGLIGTAYFTWYDQDVMGRFDGENYNCGCIDVTDCPYPEQTQAMMESARVLYSIHAGVQAPYDQKPQRARGHDHGPDAW